MSRGPAAAKINLALVVGPRRPDGLHELTTVLQRVDLVDRISVEPAARPSVSGFADDTLVASALRLLGEAAGLPATFAARIDKRIPVAAGLGGGSSDAATALRLANEQLEAPLSPPELHAVACEVGADVPFFLQGGPQLAIGDGTELAQLDLPQDYWVLLAHPPGAVKQSTRAVYEQFDARDGAAGYEARRLAVEQTLAGVRRPRDLAALPPNDLCTSPLSGRLRELGAFRADVTGAGPVVYGLFHHREAAQRARRAVSGRTWLTVPAWYF